jgi:FdhE protein
VAPEYIRRLIGRPAVMPPEVNDALGELARLGKERQALDQPAALLRAILPALFGSGTRETPPVLAPEHAAAKLEGGIPLLRGEAVNLDWQGCRRRCRAVCAAVQRQQQDPGAGKLSVSLQAGRLDLRELVQELIAGRPEGIHAHADRLGLDHGLIATILRLTILPALAQVNATLSPLREGTDWQLGYCPTCGSWPLLAEYRGLEQTRFLRCGWCTGEWEFPRLACPFCGGRDHRLLGYFSVEGEESRYRAATCDACGGYVKMISTLGPLSAPHLLVADLATLHLDLAAAQRGYGETQ